MLRDYMKNFSKTRSLSLFQKIFLSNVFSIVIPTIIITISIYIFSKASIEREVSLSNMDILRQTSISVDSIIESTENVCLQAISSQEITRFFNEPLEMKTFSDGERFRYMMNFLETLGKGAKHIESIVVYSYSNNMIVSTGSGAYRTLDNSEFEKIEQYLKTGGNGVWIEPGDTGVFGQKNKSLQYLRTFYNSIGRPAGFVVLQLKGDELSKLVESIYLRKTGYIMIINSQGKPIISRNKTLFGETGVDFNTEWIPGDEGYRKVQSGQYELLVSHTGSKFNGWKYVAVLHTVEIEEKVGFIKWIIVIFGFFFTFAAVLLSFAVSKGIYNPIKLIYNVLTGAAPAMSKLEKIVERKDELGQINREIRKIIQQLSFVENQNDTMTNENTTLKKQLDENASTLKNYFLYRIICGDIFDESEIQSQTEFFNIDRNADYAVVILDFDKSFEDIISEMTEDTSAGIREGILELFEKSLAKEVAPIKVFFESNENNDRIIGIVGFTKRGEQSSRMESLKLMFNFLQNIIFSNFRFTVTISVGNVYNSLNEIRRSYEEAVQGLRYKFILGSGSVIFKHEIDNGTMVKPRQNYYRKHFKNSLYAKNINEIQKVLNGIKEDTKANLHSGIEHVYYCKDIINIISEYLGEINYLYLKDIEELNTIFLEFEKRFGSIEEAFDWVMHTISDIFTKLESDKEPMYVEYIRKALDIIEKEYNTDLSLADVSERLKLNESYLSKLFKEETGKNFKEYLTELKIRQAKDLLRGTGMTIAQIAQQVGYNSTLQFNRMFKKVENHTPAEYRDRVN